MGIWGSSGKGFGAEENKEDGGRTEGSSGMKRMRDFGLWGPRPDYEDKMIPPLLYSYSLSLLILVTTYSLGCRTPAPSLEIIKDTTPGLKREEKAGVTVKWLTFVKFHANCPRYLIFFLLSSFFFFFSLVLIII